MYNKVKSENACNMQVMQELLTNKPNFPFNHIVDLYNIIHVAKYLFILFTNNISFYFNYCYYVQKLVKRGTSGHIMPYYNIFQKNLSLW